MKDSEADWLKMRDIAEETQRKLDEALKVISKIAHDRTPPWDKLDSQGLCLDFLAKIEDKY